MRYGKWFLDLKRFLAVTGYTLLQFAELLHHFKDAHDSPLSSYSMDRKVRKTQGAEICALCQRPYQR